MAMYEGGQDLFDPKVWSAMTIALGILLGLRANRAYSRFWEGITLVQMMRAEWLEASSNLMAFTRVAAESIPKLSDRMKAKELSKKVLQFEYTLIRLMSLMHGAALNQIRGNQEDFDVLDAHGLDDKTLDYLMYCANHDINRVEVLLHWIQQHVTMSSEVLQVPPPILSRVYQTLSRGMVNFHNAKKLTEVPFPFPLSQIVVVLLLVHGVFVPIFMVSVTPNYFTMILSILVQMVGMWGMQLVSAELEHPFGEDPNDLPLAQLQFEMNRSLLVLVDPHVQRRPTLKESAGVSPQALQNGYGSIHSKTDFKERQLGKASQGQHPDSIAARSMRKLYRTVTRSSVCTTADNGEVYSPPKRVTRMSSCSSLGHDAILPAGCAEGVEACIPCHNGEDVEIEETSPDSVHKLEKNRGVLPSAFEGASNGVHLSGLDGHHVSDSLQLGQSQPLCDDVLHDVHTSECVIPGNPDMVGVVLTERVPCDLHPKISPKANPEDARWPGGCPECGPDRGTLCTRPVLFAGGADKEVSI